jgi:hypothetical protein
MSVTITLGGVTITGSGVSFSAAPPPSVASAGWFQGGATPGITSRVQRVTFVTDTATASIRGPLSSNRQFAAAAGNFEYAWIGGGWTPATVSSVDRITYASDTATATIRGPLSVARARLGATGNTTAGWFAGGVPSGTVVDRITYATDTATASVRGPLTAPYSYPGSATGTATQGWFAGGATPSPAIMFSTVQRITYATDTAATSIRGPLSTEVLQSGATTDSTTYGWFGGGSQLPAAVVYSTIARITYATDTAATSIRGPLSVAKRALAAACSTEYGWFGGGYVTSNIDRIEYATDTATASTRGPLSVAAGNLTGTAGSQ